MSDLNVIFELVGRLFPEQGVQALLVGGHAVNAHGVTRATLDVDFLIVADQEGKVRSLLKCHGFVNQSSHGNVLFCNRPGSALRIDFLLTDSQTLAAMWAQRKVMTFADAPSCAVVDLEHLVAMKLTALRSNFAQRRAKDLPDILALARKHNWSFREQMKPLVDQFGNPELEIELRNAWEAAP